MDGKRGFVCRFGGFLCQITSLPGSVSGAGIYLKVRGDVEKILKGGCREGHAMAPTGYAGWGHCMPVIKWWLLTEEALGPPH